MRKNPYSGGTVYAWITRTLNRVINRLFFRNMGMTGMQKKSLVLRFHIGKRIDGQDRFELV